MSVSVLIRSTGNWPKNTFEFIIKPSAVEKVCTIRDREKKRTNELNSFFITMLINLMRKLPKMFK